VANANLKHLALARKGRDKILAGDCDTVQDEFDAIVDQMTIPLIQGMLKYAYESDPAAGLKCVSTGGVVDNSGDCDKALAEGWAFYAGSLEGTAAGDEDTDGVMVFKLASKRCVNFGTCDGGTSGVAKANLKHLALARSGRDKILAGDCSTVQEEFDAIVDQMTIPLIQGMLKYAYESDPAAGLKCVSTGGVVDNSGDCDKALAEGWAFAAAVLPRLNFCDSTVAKKVKDNLDVTTITDAMAQKNTHMKDGYATLKAEVEKTYACLGITCEEVGVYQTTAGVAKGGMSVCGTTASSGSSGSADAATTAKPVVDSDSGAVVAAFAMVLLNVYT
jgi:hypothetical protein